jgi:digeranylgeranylglycerophospholipid reductase
LREKYDVVVVGAGPAGSMAARAVARAGAKVLLLDKRRELGVPVQCGEALGEAPLRDLGVKLDPRWIAGEVNAVRLISPSGLEVSIAEKKVARGSKVGFILDRKVFDKHLAMLAAKDGADVRVGTLVDGLLMDGKKITGVKASSFGGRMEVEAEVVIAADGVISRVARWAGVNTALKLADIESGAQFQMVGIDIKSPEVMEYYFGSRVAPGGYAWIFPKGRDMANVGIGILGSRMQRPAIDYLKDFVDSMPGLKKGRVIEINCGGVPVGGPLPKTVKDNLLIVGDAARQVNPLTGGGIDSAMRAGDIAGEVAAKAAASGDVSEKKLEEYEKRWRELLEKKLQRYLKAKEVLLGMSDEELDKLAIALRGVEFEKISLTDMLKVFMKVSPKLMWKLKRLM